MPRLNIKFSPISIVLILILMIQGGNLISLGMLLAALAIHEISHLFTSEYLEYQASELKITSLGGRLQIDPLFEVSPEAEFLIAVSGPLANWLMVGGVAYLKWLGFGNHYLDLWQRYNFFIGFINLIPAFPLDGGRILHAWLNQMLGLEKSIIWVRNLTIIVAVFLLGFGATKLYHQQGGFIYVVIASFIFVNIIYIKQPQLDLIWRLLQRKRNILQKKGFLNLKPVLVTPETRIWDILRKYGSHDYLIFYIYQHQSQMGIIQEDFAWETIVNHGYQALFKDSEKPKKTGNLQNTTR